MFSVSFLYYFSLMSSNVYRIARPLPEFFQNIFRTARTLPECTVCSVCFQNCPNEHITWRTLSERVQNAGRVFPNAVKVCKLPINKGASVRTIHMSWTDRTKTTISFLGEWIAGRDLPDMTRHLGGNRDTLAAKNQRDIPTAYYNYDAGAVAWQERMIR